VVWRAEATPYGEIHTYRGGSAKHQPLRFPGQEQNATGDELSYNVFRWYRAGWGRYTQADPLGIEPDLNVYRYVSNRPTAMTDRTGLCKSCDECPSGEWNFINPGFAISGAIIAGKSVTWGTYACKGKPELTVKVKITCDTGGPMLAAGLGFTGPTGWPPMACSCSESGLFNKSSGWTGSFLIFSIDGGPCETKPGGQTLSVGVGKGLGAGFSWTKCTTKRAE
jgi:RHS repeat-associated protein